MLQRIKRRIGVTFPQAIRSCGNNGPSFVHSNQFHNVKRTPRCLKLHVKKSQHTNSRIQDMNGWTDCILAPPNNKEIKYVIA